MPAKKKAPIAEVFEALGLTAAEFVTELQTIAVRPGDLIVLKTAERLRPEFALTLRKQARRLFPGNEVLVLDGGIEFAVISEAEAEGGSGG